MGDRAGDRLFRPSRMEGAVAKVRAAPAAAPGDDRQISRGQAADAGRDPAREDGPDDVGEGERPVPQRKKAGEAAGRNDVRPVARAARYALGLLLWHRLL